MTIFDASWEGLDLDDVKRFLDEAVEEGLTWEAKGGDVPHRESVANAVCGFANSEGGYLILGAERKPGGWLASGVDFPGGEAGPWLSQIIGTLRPVPPFDVKVWRADDDRRVAVVRVDRVSAGPCMTRHGRVLERTSGRTVTVDDPTILARLVDQAERARDRARNTAFQGSS